MVRLLDDVIADHILGTQEEMELALKEEFPGETVYVSIDWAGTALIRVGTTERRLTSERSCS